MTPQEKQQLKEVYDYVQEKKRQQLSYPLDIFSQDIIRDRTLIFTDLSTSTITEDQAIGVVVNGVKYQINVKKTS